MLGNKRQHVLKVLLSRRERALLGRAASGSGLPLSTWVRVVMMVEARKLLRRTRPAQVERAR